MAKPPRAPNEAPNIYGDTDALDSPRVVGYDTIEPESLENQEVELGLVLSIQPLASRLPPELVGSSQDSPPASPQPI